MNYNISHTIKPNGDFNFNIEGIELIFDKEYVDSIKVLYKDFIKQIENDCISVYEEIQIEKKLGLIN